MKNINSIKNRISVRSFKDRELSESLAKQIQELVNKRYVGPFGNEIKFKIIDTKSRELASLGKMTSYGVIKGARLYIVGYCKPDNESLYDYGYCLEELILDLTDLNVGTCWLGGTFGRGFISKAVDLPDNMVIPAITPIGLIHEKRKFSDKLVRYIAKSDKRKTHDQLFFNLNKSGDVSVLDFNENKPNVTQLLEMVRIAPSASNKQPWRIIVNRSSLHLYWDYDQAYNSGIKSHNIQALDMGIALSHLKISADDLGISNSFSVNNPNIDNVSWNYVGTFNIGE